MFRFQKKHRRISLLIAVFLGVTMLSGLTGAWLQSRSTSDDLITARVGNQKKIVTGESRLISQIARSVGPSVVSITVDIQSGDAGTDLFGLSQPPSARAAGTGIILSRSGLIVTNRHVVPKEATKVSVTLSDGTELRNVSVIGRTNDNDSLDVAFLKINDLEGHKLPAAVIGDSSTVEVGDNVVAIGNALGQFQNTVTSGIISGFGRSVQAGDATDPSATENLDNLFQTDAAINQGNSGGPLVSLNGQVIGINTAVAGDGAQNIGFAIPINDVRGLINQVIKTGKFVRPYLGVHYIPLTPEAAKAYELKVTRGAFIPPSSDQLNSSVIAGGPAAKAGLQEKDIILAVNDKKIDQRHSLPSLLGAHEPGDKVKLTILRGTKTLHITATLGTLPTAE